MQKKAKPKVGFFGMTSCKGCYFPFLLLGYCLLDIFYNLDVSHFWMLKEDNKFDNFDIAIMDGAVSNKGNIELVKKVREVPILMLLPMTSVTKFIWPH